jgi:hypothetical protein
MLYEQKDEKLRLDMAKQQLVSLNYHPLRDYTGVSGGDHQSNIKRKKKNP